MEINLSKMILFGEIYMNKNLLTIIAGLVMFLIFFMLKTEVSYILCFFGLLFLSNGILKYFEHNKKISGLLSLTSILIGIFLMHIQFKLNYFALGLFVFLLIVLWILNFNYYSKAHENAKQN